LLWTIIYLGMLLLATLVLLVTEPGLHLDRTLFLTASALGNVGLSHDPIVVSDAGLCALSVTMLLGRIAPVLMLWHAFKTTPESTVAVG
jgi:Trk-type K+ transport system membrane component